MRYYIAECRMKRGISTRKLSEMSGVSRSQIVDIEAGKANPKIETLEKLAFALKVSLHSLFDSEYDIDELDNIIEED